ISAFERAPTIHKPARAAIAEGEAKSLGRSGEAAGKWVRPQPLLYFALAPRISAELIEERDSDYAYVACVPVLFLGIGFAH
ncbi:MAG TPA: hypothetical protein VGF73_05555, partial [Chthoniobacterales bacterium]